MKTNYKGQIKLIFNVELFEEFLALLNNSNITNDNGDKLTFEASQYDDEHAYLTVTRHTVVHTRVAPV